MMIDSGIHSPQRWGSNISLSLNFILHSKLAGDEIELRKLGEEQSLPIAISTFKNFFLTISTLKLEL